MIIYVMHSSLNTLYANHQSNCMWCCLVGKSIPSNAMFKVIPMPITARPSDLDLQFFLHHLFLHQLLLHQLFMFMYNLLMQGRFLSVYVVNVANCFCLHCICLLLQGVGTKVSYQMSILQKS